MTPSFSTQHVRYSNGLARWSGRLTTERLGLRAAAVHRPHLILIDVDMPEHGRLRAGAPASQGCSARPNSTRRLDEPFRPPSGYERLEHRIRRPDEQAGHGTVACRPRSACSRWPGVHRGRVTDGRTWADLAPSHRSGISVRCSPTDFMCRSHILRIVSATATWPPAVARDRPRRNGMRNRGRLVFSPHRAWEC